MKLVYSLVIAFSMYSRIPMPRVDWTKERMRYVFCFFPVIGVAIGAVMLLWMQYGQRITGDQEFFTAVLVVLPVVVTGGIHLDGLLDTSDALSSYKTLEEKLEILKDSHAGAFAIIVGCCYFILDFGIFHAVDMRAMRMLAVGYVLSRALSGFGVVTLKKAKKSGLVAAFSDSAQKRTVAIAMLCYIAACFGVLLWLDPIPGICIFAFAVLWFLCYRSISYRKFGGITGDLAGFFLQICELGMAGVAVIVIHML